MAIAELAPRAPQIELDEASRIPMIDAREVFNTQPEHTDGLKPNMTDRLLSTRVGRFGTVLLTSLGVAAPAGLAETSAAQTMGGTAAPLTTESFKTTFSYSVAGAKVKSEAISSGKIVGNHRTISKARAKKDKRAGSCDRLTAKQVMARGIKTAGYSGSGPRQEYDNRPGTFCDSDKDGDYDYRAECGNKATGGRPQPKRAKSIVWVKNFNTAKLTVKANAEASGAAYCVNADRTAGAYASFKARGTSQATVKLRSVAKAGGVGKVESNLRMSAVANARASAAGEAIVHCAGTVILVEQPCPDANTYPEGGRCIPYKDGTQTPPPPANAPGPNPEPSPQDPAPGGHQCYDEETGQPAEPRPDGTCPEGTYGGGQ